MGGPSAPLERTVRPSQSCNPPGAKTSLVIFSTDRRTVRSPMADRPPFTLKSHQGPNTSLVKKLSDLRTVRVHGPDRPQSNLSAQARETTSLDDFSKTPSDCPRARSGPSAVRPSSPKIELQPLWTKRIKLADRPHKRAGPSARQFFFPQVDQHQLHLFLLCKCANTTT